MVAHRIVWCKWVGRRKLQEVESAIGEKLTLPSGGRSGLGEAMGIVCGGRNAKDAWRRFGGAKI